MEWLLDPTVWVGLAVLVTLEVVLGIDNLLFVAALADKLPSQQRERARILGLVMALLMHLLVLGAVVWLLQFTTPWFSMSVLAFSLHDLVVLVGGVFLLSKATLELRERFLGKQSELSATKAFTRFSVVLAQVFVLNAVLSLDAAMTAIGLLEHLPVMMAAAVAATVIMLMLSKPLMTLLQVRPSLVVLSWGSLFLIGLSLVAEGFGLVVPRTYLYAAFVFALALELLNGLAQHQQAAPEASDSLRERTAQTVLRLLGHPVSSEESEDTSRKDRRDRKEHREPTESFGVEERNMVSGVLTLADRTVRSIMTPRIDVSWINAEDEPDAIRQQIEQAPHSFFPVCRGDIDKVIGIGRAKRMITDLLTHGHIREKRLHEPVVVHDTISIIRLIDTLKHAKGQLVLVANEFGNIEGLVTPLDVFEAIAGEFPDENEVPDIVPDGENRWRIDGAADLHLLEQVLQTEGLVNDDEDYTTLAGYLLNHFGQLPNVGDRWELGAADALFTFRVARLERRRIAMVHVEKHPKTEQIPSGEHE